MPKNPNSHLAAVAYRPGRRPGSHILAALLLLLALPLGAAPENKVVLDIAGSRENPRNSEGGLVTLKAGAVAFYYTQFHGGGDDDSPARIVEIHSADRGDTWSAPRVVVTRGENLNVMSVSLLRLADGRLAMFYAVKKTLANCRPYVCFSTDDGATWSPAKAVFDSPGYFVLNNDRIIQTASGRLIVPVAYHRVLNPLGSEAHAVDYRGIVLWYLSDDMGATWREASTWWASPVASRNTFQEPGVVQLADGSLFSWARTDLGTQYGFRSSDDGATWSAPQPTELKSPCSPASIKRLPNSEALLAVFNDYSGRFPYTPSKTFYRGRSPLVAAISRDGGKTWPVRTRLEDEPMGEFCYTAIHFIPDGVLLAYVAYFPRAGHGPDRYRLRIRRLDLAAIGSQVFNPVGARVHN